MRDRDKDLLVMSSALLALFVAILSVHLVLRPPTPADDGHFVGAGEGFAGTLAAQAATGPMRLGRFWYSQRIDNPNQFFKVWVNWGDPQHQGARDAARGFWARLQLDLEHSAAGKWCYEIENWNPTTAAVIAAPSYQQAGSYVASMKVWDGDRTALKPNIAATLDVQ
jgi:hypothetical protein